MTHRIIKTNGNYGFIPKCNLVFSSNNKKENSIKLIFYEEYSNTDLQSVMS